MACDYMLEIDADGGWTIKTVAVTKAAAIPSGLEGTGSVVTGAFQLEPKHAYTFSAKYEGEGNFIVVPFDAATGDRQKSVANEIGKWEGESVLTVDDVGYYVLEIQAEGKWTVTVK